MQKLTGLFITSGFTTLEEFSELDESDLDDLHVVHAEERVKLLTAAQLLSDYDNTSKSTAYIDRPTIDQWCSCTGKSD